MSLRGSFRPPTTPPSSSKATLSCRSTPRATATASADRWTLTSSHFRTASKPSNTWRVSAASGASPVGGFCFHWPHAWCACSPINWAVVPCGVSTAANICSLDPASHRGAPAQSAAAAVGVLGTTSRSTGLAFAYLRRTTWRTRTTATLGENTCCGSKPQLSPAMPLPRTSPPPAPNSSTPLQHPH